MQQFQSLQRLLSFHGLTLLVMLALYYFTLFYEIKEDSKAQSINTFYALQQEINKYTVPTNAEVKAVLKKSAFEGTSYQLIFMMPSGQTYIHRHARPNEPAFATVTFPIILSSFENSSRSAYTVNNRSLAGTIKLRSGHQVYIILRHKPLVIDWISYRYWLPLTVAIILFVIAFMYMLRRRTNWEQLLSYTENLSNHAKEAYSPPPFLHKDSTTEFMYLGHALSRVSYQLHNDYRRIKTLTHRLERLVEQAPLPMLMIMRHGQISFFNQRFEQVFTSVTQDEKEYQLTDFVAGKDEATQMLLQTLSSLRLTRTVLVYGLQNQQVYQLHITPWFGEHGQVHGFTVLLNNIHELAIQTEQLQQQNQQLQQKLDELNKRRGMMGYQLRVPLETMIDTLEPINPANLTDRQNDVVKTLIKTSQDMLTILNDTLDIGEIEVRKTRLNIAPVDIYKLGQEVNNLSISNTRQQGLELIYFFAPECPRYIDTDDMRLRQILLNLLENAIRFTTSGYVALIVDSVSDEQVAQINSDHLLPIDKNKKKATEPPSHWIRFSIKDTGTADKQQQLLTSFDEDDQTAHHQTEQNKITTGGGLNNANSFAQILGGFIEFQSMADKGSVFTLYLPCRRPDYQPVYHRNEDLTHIHLIAIVNKALVTEKLQRLCKHLSITLSVYTSIEPAIIQPLITNLTQTDQTLAPVLLLDYEYYETIMTAVSTQAAAEHTDISYPAINDVNAESGESAEVDDIEVPTNLSHQVSINHDQQQALSDLLAYPSLPKILFSMKPERRIPAALLDKYDGYLTKPLDTTLLLSELLRLTSSARQKLNHTAVHEKENSEAVVEVDESNSLTPAPLILVVEDSPTNQKITCKVLSKLGYRSVVAEDGQQALVCLKSQRQDISLILMDCRMPVMDGLQATQAIRTQGDDIPIIALTANDTKEDRDACIQAGMDEFLSKPINKKELETLLQRFIAL